MSPPEHRFICVFELPNNIFTLAGQCHNFEPSVDPMGEFDKRCRVSAPTHVWDRLEDGMVHFWLGMVSCEHRPCLMTEL